MTQEEKAQAYDDALKRAKRYWESPRTCFDIDALTEIFPELKKESEDERMLREIKRYIKEQGDKPTGLPKGTVAVSDMIAWLEKQGEQKHAIFIPKFRVGDKLVSTKNPRLTYEVLEVGHINELGNPEYKVEIFTDGKVSTPRNIHNMECYKVDEWAKLIEQKPAEWSEEDEVMIKAFDSIIRYIVEVVDKDVLERFGTNRVELFSWLKSLRPQPKTEWSKEDESVLEDIKVSVASYWDEDRILDWLKSLKERIGG